MKFIKTNSFVSQLNDLSKKYPKVFLDFSYFEKNISLEPFSDLWNWIFKYRIKNSSIPVWKRWWFRIILKNYKNNILPLLIYSKNSKENVSDIEIIESLEKVISEL